MRCRQWSCTDNIQPTQTSKPSRAHTHARTQITLESNMLGTKNVNTRLQNMTEQQTSSVLLRDRHIFIHIQAHITFRSRIQARRDSPTAAGNYRESCWFEVSITLLICPVWEHARRPSAYVEIRRERSLWGRSYSVIHVWSTDRGTIRLGKSLQERKASQAINTDLNTAVRK